jgi:ketosteroid isomerase-like protein
VACIPNIFKPASAGSAFMIQADDNVRIVRNIYQNFTRGNIPAILDVMDSSIECNVMINWPDGPKNVPYAGRFKGRGGVAKCFARFLDLVRLEPEIIPRQYIINGDSVMVSGSELRRVRPTRQLTENRWSMIWTLRNGKVVKFIIYEDTVEAL